MHVQEAGPQPQQRRQQQYRQKSMMATTAHIKTLATMPTAK